MNHPPVAVDQTVSTPKGKSVLVTPVATGVDSSALTYSTVAPPLNGILKGVPPDVVHFPKTGFTGGL